MLYRAYAVDSMMFGIGTVLTLLKDFFLCNSKQSAVIAM